MLSAEEARDLIRKYDRIEALAAGARITKDRKAYLHYAALADKYCKKFHGDVRK